MPPRNTVVSPVVGAQGILLKNTVTVAFNAHLLRRKLVKNPLFIAEMEKKTYHQPSFFCETDNVFVLPREWFLIHNAAKVGGCFLEYKGFFAMGHPR